MNKPEEIEDAILVDDQEQTPEESEKSFSEGYKKAYDNLISQGYNPRKARRYLDSIAKRNVRKFMKGKR